MVKNKDIDLPGVVPGRLEVRRKKIRINKNITTMRKMANGLFE